MIAGPVEASDPSVNAAAAQRSRKAWRNQQMVDPQSLVPGPALAQVRPEGPGRLGRIEGAQGVGPTLIEQPLEGRAAFGAKQRVAAVGMVGIDVGLRRDDIVVAGQDDWRAARQQARRMPG